MGLLDGVKEWFEERRQANIKEIRADMDREIINLSRKQDQFNQYYKMDNDCFANERIFKIEKAYINFVFNKYRRVLWKLCGKEEIEKMKAEFMERAELWYELRESDTKFSPEKMERLIKLEENSYHGEGLRKLWGISMMFEAERRAGTSFAKLEHTIEKEKAKTRDQREPKIQPLQRGEAR